MTPDERIQQHIDTARLNAVPIRELLESERPLLLAHLLALGPHDRYLRFGGPLTDAIISAYVEGIDFARDVVFGVFDLNLQLEAAGHFATMHDANPRSRPTAEFGLSVAEAARGRGLGTALFVRAATHARNQGITVLFMHCLTHNKAMMRIARRAGMQIQSEYGESDAFITLPPADPASQAAEAMQEQIALFDFAVKQQMLHAMRFWSLPTFVPAL